MSLTESDVLALFEKNGGSDYVRNLKNRQLDDSSLESYVRSELNNLERTYGTSMNLSDQDIKSFSTMLKYLINEVK